MHTLYLILVRVFLPEKELLEFPAINRVQVVADLLPSPGHTAFQRR